MTELGVFFSGAGAQDYVSNEQVLARFNSLDADENGEVSSFEFATAPALAMNSRHLQHLPAAFLGLVVACSCRFTLRTILLPGKIL